MRPFTSYPAAKHPKYSDFAFTNIREKPANFFLLYDMRDSFSSRNNFANLQVPWQKFQFLENL